MGFKLAKSALSTENKTIIINDTPTQNSPLRRTGFQLTVRLKISDREKTNINSRNL